MFKSTILLLLAVFTLSASAQDFFSRDRRENRRGDYRRGVGDGRECANLDGGIRESYCNDLKYGPRGYSSACDRMATYDSVNLRIYAYQDGSPTTRRLVEQANACEGERSSNFDRDIDADTERYERELAEREEQERRRN